MTKCEQRNLLVLSGPSGSGKDTILKQLLLLCPDMKRAVTSTTRAMREGEAEGIDYFFLTPGQFENRIEKGDFLEYTHYCGNLYGSSKSRVNEQLKRGLPVVLVIEVEGAANVKKIYPECTDIFIKPPSMEELERRLRLRGTESDQKIKARLRRAKEELKYAVHYDSVLVNDDLLQCAQEVKRIFESRRCQPGAQG